MNTLQKTLIALATGSLMSVSAQAAISYGNGATAQPYLGAKIGQYNPDGSDVDSATSYGVYGGLKFTPNFGLEAEYLTTSDETVESNSLAEVDYSGKVYGLYGTYDYVFPNTGGLYAKGRLGFAKNEIKVEGKARETIASQWENGSSKVSDTGVAGGIGLGYNITPMASVEAMYNMYPTVKGDNDTDDLDVTGITLGAHLKF